MAHPAPGCEQVGPGHVEEVVAGHADAHRGGALGCEHPVEAALVVGVGLGLGRIRRLGPDPHGGLHPLHGQVGALHQADLDGGSAAALSDLDVVPVHQVHQRVEGVGQVGLQRDAGVESR